MKPSEIIDCILRAEKELQPVIDFINAGRIEPNDGCISYLYAAALLRSNAARDAIHNLRAQAMQYAREKEKIK